MAISRKDAEAQYGIKFDSGLHPTRESANLEMRFQYKKQAIQRSTETDDWMEAQQVITALRKEMKDQHIFGTQPTMTVRAAFEFWISAKTKVSGWSEKSIYNANFYANRTIGTGVDRRTKRTFAGIQCINLHEINSSVMQKLVDSRIDENVNYGTINNELTNIAMMVKYCASMDKKTRSLENINFCRLPHNNERLRDLSDSDVISLLDHLKQDDRDFVTTVALMGSRKMEVAKCKWENINWNTCEVKLYNSKGKHWYTKVLDGELLEIFERRRDSDERPHGNDYVFHSKHKGNKHRSQDLAFFHKAANAAGLNDFDNLEDEITNREIVVMHHLRHYYIMQLCASNELTEDEKMLQSNHKSEKAFRRYKNKLTNPAAGKAASIVNNRFTAAREAAKAEQQGESIS